MFKKNFWFVVWVLQAFSIWKCISGSKVFTLRTFLQKGPRAAGNPSQHVSLSWEKVKSPREVWHEAKSTSPTWLTCHVANREPIISELVYHGTKVPPFLCCFDCACFLLTTHTQVSTSLYQASVDSMGGKSADLRRCHLNQVHLLWPGPWLEVITQRFIHERTRELENASDFVLVIEQEIKIRRMDYISAFEGKKKKFHSSSNNDSEWFLFFKQNKAPNVLPCIFISAYTVCIWREKGWETQTQKRREREREDPNTHVQIHKDGNDEVLWPKTRAKKKRDRALDTHLSFTSVNLPLFQRS